VRTDAAMGTPCDHEQFATNPQTPQFAQRCSVITPVDLPVQVICGIQAVVTEWGNDWCRLFNVPPKRSLPEEGKSISAKEIITYPNPVRYGDAITVEYGTAGAERIDVVVSDMLGNTVYSGTAEKPAAGSTLRIGTAGWAAGTYMLRIDADGITRTGHVTVVAR
jgi:Secretion system C-terminal sorting domain